jgi:hypothetical protein
MIMPTISSDGTQVLTHVFIPIWDKKIWFLGP